jgi:hypothetical protein
MIGVKIWVSGGCQRFCAQSSMRGFNDCGGATCGVKESSRKNVWFDRNSEMKTNWVRFVCEEWRA